MIDFRLRVRGDQLRRLPNNLLWEEIPTGHLNPLSMFLDYLSFLVFFSLFLLRGEFVVYCISWQQR